MKSRDLRLLLLRDDSRRLFIFSVFAALISSAIVLINAVLIAEIITRIISRNHGVGNFIGILGALWLFRAFFISHFELWSSNKASEIKAELRSEATSHIGYGKEVSSSELSNLLTKGLNSLDIYFGRFVPQMVAASITPLIIIAVLFYEDVLSGLIAFLTLPLIPVFGALIGRYSADAVARKWKTLGTLSRYFEDSLRGFATLKIFGRDKTQAIRIREMGDRYTEETMKVLKVSFLSAFALELIATLSVAVIAVSVGLRLVSGSMDFRSALIILILAPDVYFPVRNAASLFHASEDGTQALAEIGKLTAKDVAISEPEPHLTNSIEWSEWKLSKEDGSISIFPSHQVKRGELLFLTGASGTGKTTFAMKLLDEYWQRDLGWVPQNPQLATGSIREQFLLLDPSVSDEQIVTALTEAGLQLKELSHGLNTHLGSGGEQGDAVSGGQVRRIALARALFRNPEVLIADEPTADLDDETSRIVMGALRRAQQTGAIVICITHETAFIEARDLRCDAYVVTK